MSLAPPLSPLDADAPQGAILRAYRDDGAVVLRGIFARSQLEAVTAEIEHFAASPKARASNLRCRFLPAVVGQPPILDAVDPVIDVVPSTQALANDATLLDILTPLVGDWPVLFKDKAHFRRPGIKGYPVHQDYISWPGFPTTFTTVLVALDAATAEAGCVEIYSGQHRRGYLSPRDGDFHDLSPAAFPESSKRRLDLQVGDVAIFGAFLPHGSSTNRSAHSRRQLYFSYNARFDGGDLRHSHYAQYFRWLEERYRQFGNSSASFE